MRVHLLWWRVSVIAHWPKCSFSFTPTGAHTHTHTLPPSLCRQDPDLLLPIGLPYCVASTSWMRAGKTATSGIDDVTPPPAYWNTVFTRDKYIKSGRSSDFTSSNKFNYQILKCCQTGDDLKESEDSYPSFQNTSLITFILLQDNTICLLLVCDFFVSFLFAKPQNRNK